MTTNPAPSRPDVGAPGLDLDERFLRRLERLALRARRVAGAGGARPGGRRTPAADFVDHRPYSPGDDTRHIDWPAVARTDEVFVKVGRAPQAACVHLVLDTSPSMASCASKRRLALQLAAALGWMSLVHGDRVTLAPFPDAPPDAIWGPASGGRRGGDFLAHLVHVPWTATARTDLAPLTRHLARRGGPGGLLVIISDLWVTDDLDVALAALPAPRWDVLVMQILDRTELDPRFEGLVELWDVESKQAVTVVVDARLRAAYRMALSERIERLRTLITARGGQHVLLPADWSFERAVLPFLQRRALVTP